MNLVSSLAIVLFFTILGGFFSAAEIAMVALNEGQVERLSTRGWRGRRLASIMVHPNRFLAAGQLGLTIAHFVSAGFGAAELAPLLEPYFAEWGLSAGAAGVISFILVTIATAFAALVLGELAPKRIALQRAEGVALTLGPILDVFASISRPIIWLLSVSTNGVVRLLGSDPHAAREEISGEDLRALVAGHTDFTEEERALIDDVFDAGEREVREVMIPRTEVHFLQASTTVADAAREALESPHSRYPVIGESSDDVLGFVHLRDLLVPAAADRTVGSQARPIQRFPGTKPLLPALTEMRRRRQHLALVVDEYGGTAGIVTMEDLVEELVGDIEDEYDVPERKATTTAGPRDVDGLLHLEDFADATGVELPEGPYETVAGYLVSRLGALPQLGSTVDVDGWTLTVTELDGRRVARVRVQPPALSE